MAGSQTTSERSAAINVNGTRRSTLPTQGFPAASTQLVTDAFLVVPLNRVVKVISRVGLRFLRPVQKLYASTPRLWALLASRNARAPPNAGGALSRKPAYDGMILPLRLRAAAACACRLQPYIAAMDRSVQSTKLRARLASPLIWVPWPRLQALSPVCANKT